MLAPRRVPPCFTASVRRVVELHEGDGARGDAGGGAHHRSLAAQAREGEAGAAAALVDERHRAERVVDAVVAVGEGILDREDEARRELPERAPGVHQRRRVRLEARLGHEAVEGVRHLLHRALGRPVATIRLRHHRRDAPEELLGGLGRLAGLVLDQVALLENGDGVLRELDGSGRRLGRKGHDRWVSVSI